jgi:class 3 adenylate cyclase
VISYGSVSHPIRLAFVFVVVGMIRDRSARRPAPRISYTDVGGRAEASKYAVFCDLVGSTEIATRLDAEEWRDIVADYHRAVEEAVTRFGGYVAQKFGDGALVYFGYRLAQETDAERAVRSGLAIVEAVAAERGALVSRG